MTQKPPPPRPGPEYVKKYTGVLERWFGTQWVRPVTLICGPFGPRRREPEHRARTRGGQQR